MRRGFFAYEEQGLAAPDVRGRPVVEAKAADGRREFRPLHEAAAFWGCGCWYCGRTSPPLSFSCEFDTPVHLACLQKARKADPADPEARIMARELLEGGRE